MPYRNDKVSDIITILTGIRGQFARRTNYCGSAGLRKEAIKEFAESELRTRRYKNEHSAVETLRDACTRRLRPDIMGIRNFDGHVDQWLHEKSMALKEILLRHSKDRAQRAEVSQFFESRN